VEYKQSVGRAPPLYRRSPVPVVGNYPYCKIGKLRIAPAIVGKGQKLYRNYVEDPIGETYNLIIWRFNKSRGYSIIPPLYGGNRA